MKRLKERVGKAGEVANITATFLVEVNYDLTLEELIEAGNFDRVDYLITPENFPSHMGGTFRREICFINFDPSEQGDSSEDVLQEMEKRRLRPATLKEILALKIAYSDLPCRGLVALGSKWSPPQEWEGPIVPWLSFVVRDSLLSTDFDGNKDSSWHYAAVRVH